MIAADMRADKNAFCAPVILRLSVGFPLFPILDDRINSENDAYCRNKSQQDNCIFHGYPSLSRFFRSQYIRDACHHDKYHEERDSQTGGQFPGPETGEQAGAYRVLGKIGKNIGEYLSSLPVHRESIEHPRGAIKNFRAAKKTFCGDFY